ncbi:hypothetical protein [Aggregatilinea lenta]|uniref:hypothetical protein n=1 Tax=Aggregatilinea lenta TaxID=913108 RepID=UPI0013C34376|nr:hypothetical protein [Aggregatilinea lenta]
MSSTRDLRAYERLVKSLTPETMRDGKVIAVAVDARTAKVQLTGSRTLTTVSVLRSLAPQPGDTCALTAMGGPHRWTLTGTYRDTRAAGSYEDQNTSAELAKPANLTALVSPRLFVARWTAAPQRPDLSFELEYATLGAEEDAETYLVSGCVFVASVAPGTVKAARVRGVTPSGMRSAWSAWVSATVPASIPTGLAADLPATPAGEYYATDTERFYIAVEGEWREVVGAASDPVNLVPRNQMALFSFEGELEVGESGLEMVNATAVDKDIQRVYLRCVTPPTGAALIVDVLVDGVSLFSGTGNFPQIAAGESNGSLELESTWPEESVLTAAVTQVGADAAGADLLVHIVYGAFEQEGPLVAALGDLADVDLSVSPEQGQALVYDAATETWKPGTVAYDPTQPRYEIVTNGDTGDPELVFVDGDIVLAKV